MDRQTIMTKLIATFRNIANAPKNFQPTHSINQFYGVLIIAQYTQDYLVSELWKTRRLIQLNAFRMQVFLLAMHCILSLKKTWYISYSSRYLKLLSFQLNLSVNLESQKGKLTSCNWKTCGEMIHTSYSKTQNWGLQFDCRKSLISNSNILLKDNNQTSVPIAILLTSTHSSKLVCFILPSEL
jgi:hypothetical protein